MSDPVIITTREEYDLCKSRGFELLLDSLFLHLDINLRIELQRELFHYQSRQNDIKFYKWCWNNMSHICEETGIEIFEYNAIFISHILTKGAHTECRYDPRNVNIVTPKVHSIWEYGTIKEKQKLKIYHKNQQIIEILKKEYANYFSRPKL